MNRAFISHYSSVSPLGLTKQDFTRNLLTGQSVISKLPPDEDASKCFGLNFLGLIPDQLFKSNSDLKDEKLIQQKKEWLERLLSPLPDLHELNDVIFIHNTGVSAPIYFHHKNKGKNYLFNSDDSNLIQPEDFVDYLKTKKNLNAKCEIINFHNTCSSATAALVYAWKRIYLGLSKKILVLGFEVSNNNFYTMTSLSSLGVMNTKALDLTSAMLPFDMRRSGFIKADALACVIVESEDSLNINPKAEILSGALTADAHSLTDGVESGELVAKTMSECLKRANVSSEQVEYINAHGSGTYLNDLIELRGIQQTFGNRKDLFLSSTKSYFGHALCATGLVEIASVLSMFEHNFIVGNLNLQNSEPEFAFQIPNSPVMNHKIKYVVKNSFGFGGYNSSILLRNSLVESR